ncbi:MucBP domain-containing protein [Lacticaseibacillus absianus]|uniref:MucBP domain-containing protein n=1 Tax=Lacticaseibacillus absianus TaxID=2729623 RepID=UPI0015CD1AEB|nr:MucBP domain-containing protein [Lacticaseibacillus absianus]
MQETKPQPMVRQNRLIVRYVDQDGHKLNDDLSIFGAIDSEYTVNVPAFAGFRLIAQSRPSTGVMPTDEAPTLTLTYSKLASVMVLEDGRKPQELKLQADPDAPGELVPLQLPHRSDEKRYYLKTASGYELITDPAHFVPAAPSTRTAVYAMMPLESLATPEVPAAPAPAKAAPAGRDGKVDTASTTPEVPAAHRPADQAIVLLMAKALHQQAMLLDHNVEADLLKTEQVATLMTNMRAFMQALALMTH